MEVALARAAGVLASSQLWSDEGHISPISWLRCEARLATGVAADRVAVGTSLDQLPQSLQALERGEVGFAHFTLMARTAELYRQASFAEEPLLETARQQTVSEFHRTCEHVRHAQDPAGFAQEESERRELLRHAKFGHANSAAEVATSAGTAS